MGHDPETSSQEIVQRKVRWEFDRDTRLPFPNAGANFEHTKADGLDACPAEWGILKHVGLETMQEHVGG